MRVILSALFVVLSYAAIVHAAPLSTSRDAELQPIADFHNGTPYQQTWQVQSFYTYRVQIEFFSQARNYAWPGGNQAYPLDDSQPHTFTLNCRRGEKICYGAWATGNANIYWGVGADNRHSCTDCCQTCGDGVSRSLRLTH